jgi:hypothetical membrane protein
MFIFRFIGIINILFFAIGIYLLATKSKWFSLKKHTISHLATDSKNGSKFNTLLSLFSLGQVFFSIEVCKYYSIQENKVSILLFIIGGIFLCLASVYSLKNNSRIHMFTVFLSTTSVGFGVLLLTLFILRVNYLLGIIVLFATTLVPISCMLRNKLKGGYWELLLFSAIAIWNVALSIPLIIYGK